ncbi:uncharacterized protein LOC9651808 [Selaginella moellendorffii]|nr:uncharacterized protein LOC9651808 [Selaginella moellendorffii]|eukprot:XP_002987670.2 uncharacterized protein LOC9651808 [Selaginella moellendorffii]
MSVRAGVFASQIGTRCSGCHNRQFKIYSQPRVARPGGVFGLGRHTIALAGAPGNRTKQAATTKENSLLVLDENGTGAKKFFSSVSSNIQKIISDTLKVLQKPAIALLLIGLLLGSPEDALSASGGRMGGRSFSSGGGGRSSQTYSLPRSGGSSSSFNAYSFAAPSPLIGGGLYLTPGYSVGFGGGGIVLMLLLGFVAFQLVSGFLVDRDQEIGTTKTSVMKLQVGLLGMARSLQRELEQLANRADTSNPSGLHYILTETVLSLMRHPDFCISGTSSSEVKRSVEAGEARFNELSLEERGKFVEETLVSVDSIRKRTSPRSFSGKTFNNEYIVVTVLVAVQGSHKLPTVNSNTDLKAALSKLGSIPVQQLLAVEVLWTPQDENDALTENELLRDYPLLRPL